MLPRQAIGGKTAPAIFWFRECRVRVKDTADESGRPGGCRPSSGTPDYRTLKSGKTQANCGFRGKALACDNAYSRGLKTGRNSPFQRLLSKNTACPSEELDPAGTSNSMNVRLTEAEIHAVSRGLPYRCEFPQVKIVCQQIRGIPFTILRSRNR